jgi:integrase
VRETIEEAASARSARLRALGRKEVSVRFCERVYRKLLYWTRANGLVYLDELSALRLESFECKLRETGVAATSLEPQPVPGKKADGRRASRQPRPLKSRSIRDTMKTVRGLIRFALRRSMIATDPAAAYQLPPDDSAEARTFSPEELAQIYADPDTDQAEIWRFLTHTCLRSSEFCWLMKSDIILDESRRPKALHIRQKVCPQSGQTWAPKHKSNRVVCLSAQAAAIVARRLALPSAGPWLFQAPDTASSQKGKWEGHRLLRRLNERLKAVGFSRGKLHTFRHTGASFLANDPTSPMPLPQLQRFLGHRRITTTEIYLHVRGDDIGDSLKRIDFNRLVPQCEQGTAL